MNFIRNLNTYFLRKIRVFQKKEIVKKEQELLKTKILLLFLTTVGEARYINGMTDLTTVHLLVWGFMANVILNYFLI